MTFDNVSNSYDKSAGRAGDFSVSARGVSGQIFDSMKEGSQTSVRSMADLQADLMFDTNSLFDSDLSFGGALTFNKSSVEARVQVASSNDFNLGDGTVRFIGEDLAADGSSNGADGRATIPGNEISDGSSNTVLIGELDQNDGNAVRGDRGAGAGSGSGRDGRDSHCGQGHERGNGSRNDGERSDQDYYNGRDNREHDRNNRHEDEHNRHQERDRHEHNGRHEQDRHEHNHNGRHEQDRHEHNHNGRHEQDHHEHNHSSRHDHDSHEHDRNHQHEHNHDEEYYYENQNGNYGYDGGSSTYPNDGAYPAEQWNGSDGASCESQQLSPADMMQQMSVIAQEIAQLSEMIAMMQAGGMASAELSAGVGFPFGISAQMNAQVGGQDPLQAIGKIAELAKQLAPLASALAPVLLAL